MDNDQYVDRMLQPDPDSLVGALQAQNGLVYFEGVLGIARYIFGIYETTLERGTIKK